jgi:hypothetical protein
MKSALGLVMLACLLCAPASARDDVQTGSIMICDTQKQVERYLTLLTLAGNAQSAIRAVNTEAENPSACAVSDIAYIRGARIGIERTRTDAFEIVEILAIGLNTPAGLRAVAPATFFTLIKLKEYAV